MWQDHDLVFTTGFGTAIHPDNLDRDFKRLIKRAGVPEIRVHDCRHSFATLALAQGLPVKAVSESMGHADIATTLRTYTHVLAEQRKEIAQTMGTLFAARS